MSYQPYDRNPSGIVFFGTNSTDQTFESNAGFTIDGTSLLATNLKVSNGGNIGSVGDPDAISIAANGDVSFTQDISIAGDLTVNGTTTTVNSTTVTIDDPIFTLGGDTAPGADDNKDRGIEFKWHNGTSAKVGFFGFDDSTGKFTFVPDATISSEVVSGTAGTIVATTFEGALSGNASTATALATARDFSITGEVTASAQSFDGTGNVTLSSSLHESAVSAQSAITVVDGTNDYLLIWDATDSSLKKINRTNFVSGLGSMSSFTVDDGTTSVAVSDSETVTFADGTGAEFVVTDVGGEPTVTVNSVDSEIVHDSLSGFVANEHIDHTSVTLTAGNGLTGGGDISTNRTFNVGAGNGITVNADDIALASTTAGAGLTYTAGVLAVGEGSLIDVSADAIAVDLTEAASATIANGDYLIFLDGGATGTQSKGTVAGLASLLAGDGIGVSGSTLSVNVDGTSITIAGDTLSVGTVTGADFVESVATHASTASIASTTTVALATGGSSGITLTLPAVASGKRVTVKKVDSGSGTVTIARNSADTIDGATQKVLYSQYESLSFVSDGTDWFIV
jgi:hypothetical protein